MTVFAICNTIQAMQKYLGNLCVGACSLSTDGANISIRRLAAMRCSAAEPEPSWHGIRLSCNM